MVMVCMYAPCRIFTKVVLEAPLITESALEVIRKYCEDEVGSRSRWTGVAIKEALSLPKKSQTDPTDHSSNRLGGRAGMTSPCHMVRVDNWLAQDSCPAPTLFSLHLPVRVRSSCSSGRVHGTDS